jgi:hypothetical protein
MFTQPGSPAQVSSLSSSSSAPARKARELGNPVDKRLTIAEVPDQVERVNKGKGLSPVLSFPLASGRAAPGGRLESREGLPRSPAS